MIGARPLTRLAAFATVVAAATALAVGSASATRGPEASASRPCANISFKVANKTRVFTVRIDKGTLPCGRARRTLRTFLMIGAAPRGWVCFRGHASQHQRWAAACGTADGADIKAFAVKK